MKFRLCLSVICVILGVSTMSAKAELLDFDLELPDIATAFLGVEYDATTDFFTVGGFALTFETIADGIELISQGTLDMTLKVDVTGALTDAGSLVVIGDLGAGVTDLLTGEFVDFGFLDAPGGEIFDFLFIVTGGDLADEYGGIGEKAGIILDAGDSGFDGSFGSGFANSGFTGVADIAVPEPAAMLLILVGLAALAKRPRRYNRMARRASSTRGGMSLFLIVGIGVGTLVAVGPASADLLNPQLDLPVVNFHNSDGLLTYDADSDLLTVEGEGLPVAVLFVQGDLPVFVTEDKSLAINIEVDNNGVLVGSGDATHDLELVGEIDDDNGNDFSGTLLTGTVLGFGFFDTGGSTDRYDFVFEVTGGELEDLFGDLFGVTLLSEDSTFDGDFNVSFEGGTKGMIGPIKCLTVEKQGCVVPQPMAPGEDACDGKLLELTLIYTGEGCDATDHQQDPNKVSCRGDAAFAEPVDILVTDKDGNEIYADVTGVSLGDEVLATADNAGENDFKSETLVTIFNGDGDVIESVLFHTSCSQPLSPGNQFGSNFVQRMVTTQGGEDVFEEPGDDDGECITEFVPGSNVECEGKLEVLQLRYLGGDCDQSDHNQDSGKVSCDGDAGISEPVRILVTRDNDEEEIYADVSGVFLGDVIVASAANAGENDFHSSTMATIFDDEGAVLQVLEFHTSCSQPLVVGNVFGALQVFGMESTNGGVGSLGAEVKYTYTITNGSSGTFTDITVIDDLLGEIEGSPIAELGPNESVELSASAIIFETTTNTVTVTAPDEPNDCVATATATVTAIEPPPPAESCCDDGDKIGTLTLLYTGDDCSATSHSQDSNKVSCSGDPDDASPVHLLATDKEDPDDGSAKVWFDGLVNLDEEFILDAANAGETKLKSSTFIHIFDKDGNKVLQTIEFHTSCSQPLFIGDQFGSVQVVDCSPELDDDGDDDKGFCEDDSVISLMGPKPQVLIMSYTGDDCDATSHSQDSGKVSCDGDPDDATPVRILATDKDDPDDGSAKVWFDGQVILGDSFEIDATNAGESKLKASTFAYIFDLDDNLLQSVEFHTSCSQPLFKGDQFGSLLLEDFIPE